MGSDGDGIFISEDGTFERGTFEDGTFEDETERDGISPAPEYWRYEKE